MQKTFNPRSTVEMLTGKPAFMFFNYFYTQLALAASAPKFSASSVRNVDDEDQIASEIARESVIT